MNNASEERMIKEKLTAAMNEPTVSAEFVERMVVRANAITRGREAEKQLSVLSADAAPEEKLDLTAQGAVGRLMLSQKPPHGVTVEQMTDQLKANGAFRAFAEEPADRVLHDLKSGDFIRRVTAPARQSTHEAPEAAPAPVREAPVRTAPELGPKF